MVTNKTKKLASMGTRDSGGSSSSTTYSATEAILIADVVESVRLMEQHESSTINRWRSLFDASRSGAISANGGRVVKHTGDGVMAVFPSSQGAAEAAFAMHAMAATDNARYPADQAICLRIGINVGALVADEIDVYGRSVNLAARLMTLAGPGETIVSSEVRDQLTDDIDADIEDLGECFVKHIAQPIRAYRAGPAGRQPVIESGGNQALDLRPVIAVIPPASHSQSPANAVIGDAFADEMITALSRTPDLHVISRLSTNVLRGRAWSAGEIGARLGAPYIVTGNYYEAGANFKLFLELADSRSGTVIWADSVTTSLTSLFDPHNEFIASLAARIANEITSHELRRSVAQPLPTLESYALLMGAVSLMHRLDMAGFERARALLETLIERHPRQAVPHAWMAKWRVLRVGQGWSGDAADDARRALDSSKRALDIDSECSMALAIDGLVHTNLLKKFDIAEERYQMALRANPSDSLAHLLLGTMHAFQGRGSDAVRNTEAALLLSPLDPLKYFYDSLAATAAMSAGNHRRAIELAQRSLKANRTHTSTLRALAIAQVLSGDTPGARKTVVDLLHYEPGLTVEKYLRVNPSGMFETGRQWAKALGEAGVPHE